jgi:sterol desaturase/sphingolipid hydroxylase (fatty acid hydroxylase superfamily)
MSLIPATFQFLSPAVVPAAFVLFLALEFAFPLRRRKRSLGPHLKVNFSLAVLAFATGVLTVRPASLMTAAWSQAQAFGLLQLRPLPLWLQVVAGVALMDLTFYYWHRLNHNRPLLWRFHNVHHTDPDMDVSTGFRFHPGEVLYSTIFRVLQVGLLGVTPFTYLLYELLFICANLFQHSNLRLPVALERLTVKILVTPRMHGVHHSVVWRENYSNFSVVFSCWDRLHRSLRLNVPQAAIIIGVPAYLLPGDNRAWPLLKQPFTRQRRYWRWPGGKTPLRAADASIPRPHSLLP